MKRQKYEIDMEKSNVIQIDGKNIQLYRIVATSSFGKVKAGDVGGWIANESNLSQLGNCWIDGDAKVFGNAIVMANAIISENAMVFGNATIHENATIEGNAKVFGKAQIYGDAIVDGEALICARAEVFGNAHIGKLSNIIHDVSISEGDIFLLDTNELEAIGKVISTTHQRAVNNYALYLKDAETTRAELAKISMALLSFDLTLQNVTNGKLLNEARQAMIESCSIHPKDTSNTYKVSGESGGVCSFNSELRDRMDAIAKRRKEVISKRAEINEKLFKNIKK